MPHSASPPPPHCRALRVRKKMSGDRMPVKMIGDILTNQLPHMQPYIRFLPSSFYLPARDLCLFRLTCLFYIYMCVCVCAFRFCSCQLNGATLIQQKTDDNPEIKDFLKVKKRHTNRHTLFTAMKITLNKDFLCVSHLSNEIQMK